jgi:hypothetical protein
MALEGHRGTIKKQNKSHKHGRHRTKGQLDRDAQGKPVGRLSLSVWTTCVSVERKS